MPEVITQDELIQYLEEYEARIKELEAFVSKVANWKFEADIETHDFELYLKSQVRAATAEALALLEP